MTTAVDCECPHHLVTLIRSLNAFETYSVDCESRSPADAALHSQLAAETGRARQIVESALQAVIDSEGINLRDAGKAQANLMNSG